MNVRAIALALPVALAAGSACSHTQQGTSSTGGMGEPSERQASGGAAGQEPLAQDPIMRPGPAVQGHAGDEVIVGRLASADGDTISIETVQGDTRTLEIAPETWVLLDGQDASAQDLTEGMPVRASYDEVDGAQVAVKVYAGETASGASGTHGTGSSSDQGGTAEPGATDSGPGDSSATPDAGWGPPPVR
jgi:hypothetical protein